MNEHTARVRMRDMLNDRQFDHSPPVVVWRCPNSPPHTLLRVYRTRNTWHLLGNGFRVPLKDYLKRIGSDWTVDDFKKGKVGALDPHRVEPIDKELPLDIDAWPAGVQFEVGCHCKPVMIGLDVLAEDCRRARDERRCVKRTIG